MINAPQHHENLLVIYLQICSELEIYLTETRECGAADDVHKTLRDLFANRLLESQKCAESLLTSAVLKAHQ